MIRPLPPAHRAALSILALAAPLAAEPVKIAIVGDSTVCDYPLDTPNRGWGMFIADYFDDSVKVVNLAASGRSTKTFLAEGRWARTLAEKPAIVLIQFGHNDSHAKDKPEATDAATDYSANLRRYIDEARAAGAVPVLITPMHRRTWNPDGTLYDTLQPYADAMKAVGAEKSVRVIDLHAMSRELYLRLGEKACMDFANAEGDRTHFDEKGARTMAELVMGKLPGAVPQLKPRLKR